MLRFLGFLFNDFPDAKRGRGARLRGILTLLPEVDFCVRGDLPSRIHESLAVLPAVLPHLAPSEIVTVFSHLLLHGFHVVIIKLHLVRELLGCRLGHRLVLLDELVVQLSLLVVSDVLVLLVGERQGSIIGLLGEELLQV